MYSRRCECGALVWETPDPRRIPSYAEWLVCPQCGKDNSIPPTWRQRLRYCSYRVRKYVRLYGLVGMWRQGVKPRDLWRLPREIDEEARCVGERASDSVGR